MVGLGLGIGLGLGPSRGGAAPANPLCDAIARKVCVVAKDGDTVLKLAPHVVYKRGARDIAMLDAALLERDGKPVNNVRLRTYRLDDLTEVTLTDEGFAIDPGFESDDPIYTGRTVCIVQSV